MSAVPNTNSIGSSISGDVVEQIKARQEFMRSPTKGIEWHRSLTSRTAWVKLSSAVNIEGSSSIAKSTELSATGITGTSKLNPAYDEDTGNLGFRAVPGIDSVQVKHLNRFGTLREAVVQYKAYTVDQLDKLEQLYMRPGMSILLEWGHSTGIDNSGDRISQIETIGDSFYGTPTKTQILEKLKELRKNNAHNYEGMYGFIRNFSWSFNPDGSYSCTTTIVSIGVILEDLFLAIPSKKIKAGEVKEGENVKKKSPIHNILLTTHELFGSNEEADKAFANLTLPSIIKASLTNRAFVSHQVSSPTEDNPENISRVSYITFEAFVNILDYLFVLVNSESTESISKLTVGPSTKYLTYSNHFSGNPGVVMIGNTPSGDDVDSNLGLGAPIYTGLTEALKVNDASTIGSLWLNVDHILAQTEAATTAEGDIKLINLLQSLCTSVNKALGSINELDVAYEEEVDTYFIVDRKIIKRETVQNNNWPVTLEVTGLSSTVHNISLQSKISPEISTMIAITAQNSETLTNVGLEAENLFRWNRNLSDRIMSSRIQRGEYENSGRTQNGTIYVDAVLAWREALKEFTDTNILDIATLSNLQSAHRTVTNEGFRRSRKGTSEPAPGIIPFELTLTLDGIGGLKIGQTFKLGGQVLPSKYRNELGFIIVGVDQSITGNKWLTSIRAQTIKL